MPKIMDRPYTACTLALPSITKSIFFVGSLLLLYRAVEQKPTKMMVLVVNGSDIGPEVQVFPFRAREGALFKLESPAGSAWLIEGTFHNNDNDDTENSSSHNNNNVL